VQIEVETLRKLRSRHKPKPARTLSLTSRAMVLAAPSEAGVDLPDLQAETVADHQGGHPALAAYARWQKAQKVVSRGNGTPKGIFPNFPTLSTTHNRP
jgi:hypothetical protein